MSNHDNPAEDIIEDIEDAAEGEIIRLGTVLDRFENRSSGVVLALLGLLTAIPVIGGLPGVPAVIAILIVITAGHALLGGQRKFWAPEVIRCREVDSGKVERVLETLRPWAERMDSLIHERLSWIIDGKLASVAVALACIGLAVAMVFLSALPFGVLPAALGICLLGLAMMSHDGVLALIGYGFGLAALSLLGSVF